MHADIAVTMHVLRGGVQKVIKTLLYIMSEVAVKNTDLQKGGSTPLTSSEIE